MGSTLCKNPVHQIVDLPPEAALFSSSLLDWKAKLRQSFADLLLEYCQPVRADSMN